MTSSNIRRHIFISGKVQGVAFRVGLEIRAKLLGLFGFVRNLEDGRVEAVLEGKEKRVNKLIKWSKKGPIFAKVSDVEIIEEKYKNEFKEFNIEY